MPVAVAVSVAVSPRATGRTTAHRAAAPHRAAEGNTGLRAAKRTAANSAVWRPIPMGAEIPSVCGGSDSR